MCKLDEIKCPICGYAGFLREVEHGTFVNPECPSISIVNKYVVCDHCDNELSEILVGEEGDVSYAYELKDVQSF